LNVENGGKEDDSAQNIGNEMPFLGKELDTKISELQPDNQSTTQEWHMVDGNAQRSMKSVCSAFSNNLVGTRSRRRVPCFSIPVAQCRVVFLSWSSNKSKKEIQ